MFAQLQPEHQWLSRLIGRWTAESECIMGPDQTPSKSVGILEVEPLGEFWITATGTVENPDGDPWKSVLTIGYDPALQAYVGTFVASVMANLWVYQGHMDESGKKLVLDTQGPKFDTGEIASYQDVIELIDDDHWLLWSQIQTEEGEWQRFMTSHHTRC